ncbi:phosphatidylglycerol lysyltransferase domain-containing protein [Flavobacterium sp. F-65]|uniref:Phosphatidylglycerol lysyltransferase n=1 Tax=Flavobacterium pisciphilum TaxID=2893755 RepID=A0ABS8MPL9_9FLAO|nr:phosphatidylglycerol lysyltransferase domain-containing protein [Flavobacterium sp. F-65]MCC9070714.1 phosphatidylglycerol lysyltransferase domain-containing protein [Flavobacterium sp. F-65]
MKTPSKINNYIQIFKERSIPLLSRNGKLISQFIITLFFLGVAIWFVKQEQTELSQIKNSFTNAKLKWIIAGFFTTILYILAQGLMYINSFSAIGVQIKLKQALILFLKRNFISVFIPAGGVTSLYFFTESLTKKGIEKVQVHLASAIYGFIGILSVVIIGIPIFIYTLLNGKIASNEWIGIAIIILLIIGLFLLFNSILNKGLANKLLIKWFPKTEIFITDLQNHNINRNKFIHTVLLSIFIDIIGIVHLYIAMIALQFEPSWIAASMGYIIAVVFLIISPLLRGLGPVEVSMGFILIRYGFTNAEAISITLLYRVFEFWLPLFAGVLTFLSKINKLLMRIVPALLLFFLGIINIISVLTPAISGRLMELKGFLPLEAIHLSNYLVFTSGLFLLVTSSFMLKGLKMAWWFGLGLSIISLIGNLTKAIDFEESTLALLVCISLIATRKEYYVKTNPRLRLLGLQTAVLSVIAVLIYGIVGFYFLDKKHFNIDFSIGQSIRYTLQNYFLLGSYDLVPLDNFSKHFLASIKISGFISFVFLIYTLIKPYISKNSVTTAEKEIANELLEKYGNSSLDYFKTYFDKLLFISQNNDAFLAYRISGNFAVVLENPVAKNEAEIKQCIIEFDNYCYEAGLKSMYYRIPEENLEIYKSLGKKYFFIGQEGVVDLTTFNLEGASKKSLRNGLKKINDLQLKTAINLPPIKDGLLQKIQSVSDEWLEQTGRKEILFSQGIFLWDELKKQTIITIENSEEKIIAFLNIIPDYTKGEGTYDLIRKSTDAPNGIIDFILIELFNHLKSQNFTAVNIGLAPMSGIENPTTIQEKSMKYVYEKVKSFSHYKGLRDFKEKFSPSWHNQYIVFTDDYDLIQIPQVLAKVIKP